MSSTVHIRFEQATDRDILSGSANWAFDDGTRTFVGPRFAPVGRTVAQLARLALLLAVSSVSSRPDPWLEIQRQRSPFTVTSAFQTASRRQITPLEARRMALEILRRAEVGRAVVAQAEAERGIDWEDVS